jgi:cAMP-dependent protein kinase regulator
VINASFSQNNSKILKKFSNQESTSQAQNIYSNPENLPNWLVQRVDFKEVVFNLNQNKIYVPSIFEEHVNSRTSEQKKVLIEWIRSLKFFSKISYKVIQDVCDKLKKEEVPSGTEIIRKGDRGDCIFIIFSGTADIFLEPGVLHCKVAEKEVIGEQALDNAKPRNATVVATTDMILFKLDKFDYDTILLNIKKQEKSENLKFLEKIEFFCEWSHLKMQNFVFHILQKTYSEGKIIFDRGDPADTFFIIKSGEVEIQAYVKLVENNCWPVGWKEWKVTEIKKECIVSLIRLGPGDFFGEPCLLSKTPRLTRAISLSNTLLLTINKDEFFSIFGKKDINNLLESSKYQIPNHESLRKKLICELEQKKSTVSFK